jgi:hypothetical protein
MRKSAIAKVKKYVDKIEIAMEMINEIIEREQDYFDERSDEWHESDKAEDFEERISNVESFRDDLDSALYEINEWLESVLDN